MSTKNGPSHSDSSSSISPIAIDTHARRKLFPTTVVSEILSAKAGDQAAIESLIRRYATPAFCFLLQNVGDHEAAKDLTQEFLLDLAGGELLATYKPSDNDGEGAFRAYLKATLANLRTDDHRRRHAQRRHAKQPVLNIDQLLRHASVASVRDLPPDKAFDRAYVLDLIRNAHCLAAAACRRARKGSNFKIFARHYRKGQRWKDIDTKYGMLGGTACNRAKAVGPRFRGAMRELIGAEGLTEAELNAKVAAYIEALSAPPKRAAVRREIESL